MVQITESGRQWVASDEFADAMANVITRSRDAGEDALEMAEWFIAAVLVADEEHCSTAKDSAEMTQFLNQNREHIHRVLMDIMQKPAFQSKANEFFD